MFSTWRTLVLVLLFAGSLTLSLFAPAPGAAQTTPVVSVAPATVTVGVDHGAFTVDVLVDDITAPGGLGGYLLVVEYDPSLLRGVTMANSGFLGSTGNPVLCPGSAIDHAAGSLGFFCFTLPIFDEPGPLTTDPQVLTTITFEPLAEGTTALDLSQSALFDPQGNNLGAGTSNGQVIIQAGSSGPQAGPTAQPGASPTSPGGPAGAGAAATPLPSPRPGTARGTGTGEGGLPAVGSGPGDHRDTLGQQLALGLAGAGALLVLSSLRALQGGRARSIDNRRSAGAKIDGVDNGSQKR